MIASPGASESSVIEQEELDGAQAERLAVAEVDRHRLRERRVREEHGERGGSGAGRGEAPASGSPRGAPARPALGGRPGAARRGSAGLGGLKPPLGRRLPAGGAPFAETSGRSGGRGRASLRRHRRAQRWANRSRAAASQPRGATGRGESLIPAVSLPGAAIAPPSPVRGLRGAFRRLAQPASTASRRPDAHGRSELVREVGDLGQAHAEPAASRRRAPGARRGRSAGRRCRARPGRRSSSRASGPSSRRSSTSSLTSGRALPTEIVTSIGTPRKAPARAWRAGALGPLSGAAALPAR